ncbi:phage tail protein [Vagococcus vulneris]|uniref:Prophage tail endopeptidase domain-containing protein n=1 Tax=Vagococcus vulneris TaxID=1977869 RepID=A0A429ZTH4_9ENTE|nr:phage tail protein [Vagococcus vulneris]RST96939.1 hypothetical protein CBF37_10300 [Vagococcus vulneris]
MKNVLVMNYERTKREILTDFKRDSFKVEDKDDIFNIEFEVPMTNRNAWTFNLLENESSVFFDGQEFIVKQCDNLAHGSTKVKQVTATHITHTIQDGYQYDVMSGTKSINECLTHIFKADKQGFNYDVKNINGSISRVEQENFGNANLVKLIEEVQKDYDVTVVRDNKLFTFIPNRYFENKTNEQIRYRANTDSVSFSIDTYSLKTQIRGSGKRKEPKEGQTVGDWYFEPVTYTSPESEKWGIRIQDPIEDERYTIQSNMIDRLKRELKDYPTISGKVDLKVLNFNVQRGDLVRFVYEPLGINQFIRVVGLTRYPFSNKTPEVELDNQKRTILDYVVALMKGVK